MIAIKYSDHRQMNRRAAVAAVLHCLDMLTLRPSTVPLYLHGSELYRSQDVKVDREFTVPSTAVKADVSIESTSDLSLLFSTLAFWKSGKCFDEVINYVLNRLSKEELRIICDKYAEVWELRYLKSLQHIRKHPRENPINRALYDGYLEIAVYMRRNGFICDESSITNAVLSTSIECVRFVVQERQARYFGLPSIEKLTGLYGHYVKVTPSSVPAYLHGSELYKSLDLDNNDEFDVPILNYKIDTSVDSFMDLVLLLDTLDYWGSNAIIPEIVRFVYKEYILVNENQRLERKIIADFFAPKWKYVNTLVRIVKERKDYSRMDIALESGILELVVYLRGQGVQLGDLSMRFAIRSQNPELILYVRENIEFLLPVPFVDDVEYQYAKRLGFEVAQPNDIAMLKLCIADMRTDVMTVEYCMIAAKSGDLELLQQLHELRCPWDVTCCTEAAAQGHLHCLTYAHEQGAPWDAGTCAAAAKNKKMDCFTYLVENGCPADGTVSCAAIANGDMEMLMFAHENLLPWEDDMCMLAALASSLLCLKYLHEAGCELTSETCAVAARRSCECLKYAHDNGAPWTVSTIIAASKSGNFPRFEYAHQNGCPVDKQVWTAAINANCGNRMARYMGHNKFPYDANHCRQAAKKGSYSLLKILHIYGCPWTEATTRDAASRGCLQSLKYAAERGCPVAPITCSFDQGSFYEIGPHFRCMKYIFDNHDSSFDSICAITRDHFGCFRYAHNNGTPWSKEIVVTAARLGKVNYLRYMFEESNCPFYKYFPCAFTAAKRCDDEDCITYLEELRDEKIRKLLRSLRRLQWLRRPRINGRMVIRKVILRKVLRGCCLRVNVQIILSRFEILHALTSGDISQAKSDADSGGQD